MTRNDGQSSHTDARDGTETKEIPKNGHQQTKAKQDTTTTKRSREAEDQASKGKKQH